jgi:type IV secretory pathway VirB3-like protein
MIIKVKITTAAATVLGVASSSSLVVVVVVTTIIIIVVIIILIIIAAAKIFSLYNEVLPSSQKSHSRCRKLHTFNVAGEVY